MAYHNLRNDTVLFKNRIMDNFEGLLDGTTSFTAINTNSLGAVTASIGTLVVTSLTSTEAIIGGGANSTLLNLHGRTSDDYGILSFKTANGATLKGNIQVNAADTMIFRAGPSTNRIAIAVDGSITVTGQMTITSNLYVGGTLSKAGGSFVIPHPEPEKKDCTLRHGFVEAPNRGTNLYNYVFEIGIEETIFTLPSYWQYLNTQPALFFNQIDGFGNAYGNVIGDKIIAKANTNAIFDVLALGIRKDQMIVDWWNETGGVEYKRT